MAVTWVVTADSTSANVFEILKIGGDFRPITEFKHAEGQMKGSDLASDRPGRAFDSGGTGRHAMAPQVDLKAHEADVFAREVCEFIDNARVKNRFERLVVVAPPDFLGRLRQHISPEANKLVTESLAKNLLGCDGKEIRARLQSVL
jgi:protein required for attachment to host cells